MLSLVAVIGAVKAIAWWFVVRPWLRDWGSTPDERNRAHPGDDWIPDPDYCSTKAISIDAAPPDVWPWLVQIGRGRGGLYSIDCLDRVFGILDAPSADRILPEFQRLEPGDVIPIGGSSGWPVLSMEPNRYLTLAGDEKGTRWSWTFTLEPQQGGGTRLVSRNRLRLASPLARAAVLAVVDWPAGIMTVAMLRGVRRRAERIPRAAEQTQDRAYL